MISLAMTTWFLTLGIPPILRVVFEHYFMKIRRIFRTPKMHNIFACIPPITDWWYSVV